VESPAPWGAATLFAIPAFGLLVLAAALLWNVPWVLAGVYAALSLVAFLTYAIDKAAAQRGAWRTPETTLHVLAIAGGWPGALVAQQLFRHKSTKAEFRAVFWGTVVLNVAGFILLCSPMGRMIWGR
jgi:uncharacterized membrane protein YsdA (DUF1294 family)